MGSDPPLGIKVFYQGLKLFTGIVQSTGTITRRLPSAASATNRSLQIEIAPRDAISCKIGDSISVNGCCLTVVRQIGASLAFDISSETLEKTTLGDLPTESVVNLEPALALGDRLGGHLVSGHIDCKGQIHTIEKNQGSWRVSADIPRQFGKYLIFKGSICIDGVSLTVNEVQDFENFTRIQVTLVPTTIAVTTMQNLAAGQTINIEVDLFGKYVERLFGNSAPKY